VGKAAKRTTGRVPVPYHASRDQRVRWESDRRIKCPGSRVRVGRRAASLRSTPPDSREPVSVFDGSWRSTPVDSLDAFSIFEAAVVDDRAHVLPGRRVEGLDLCTGNLVMCIGEGTPY